MSAKPWDKIHEDEVRVTEAARILRVSLPTLQRWLRRGKLAKACPVEGKRRVLLRADVLAYRDKIRRQGYYCPAVPRKPRG